MGPAFVYCSVALCQNFHWKLHIYGLNEFSTAPCRFSDSGFQHLLTYYPTTCGSGFVIHMNCDWLSPANCMTAFSVRRTEGDDWNLNPLPMLTCIFLGSHNVILEVYQLDVILLRCCWSQLSASIDLDLEIEETSHREGINLLRKSL